LCFTGEHESCHEAAPASGIFPYPVALMNTNLEYLWHVVVIIDLSLQAEFGDAKCRPFCWGLYRSFARAA
jgi:hypothetical protein